LIVGWRGRTSEVEDPICLHIKWKRHVVTDHLEHRIVGQVCDISLGPGVEVVHTENFMALFEQTVAKMRSKKSRPSGYDDALGSKGVLLERTLHS
jgi:hypothetical protein